jgi:branched-chain amino acid transport system substrate-binding protein
VVRTKKSILLAALAILLVAASFAGAATPKAAASGSAHTYTIGLITDLTGLASSAELSTPAGVKAGVGYEDAHGYKIKYIVVDAGSSPTGALSAAQKLVEQDHVFAVIAVSGVTFGAAPYLLANGIPVFGSASDASEWTTDRNMFSVFGTANYTKVETTDGLFFKLVGAKNIGSIGYSISPSSSETAEAAAVSAEAAGLKAGYLNAAFPFGSTNVAPVALAMKNAGVDGVTAAVEENTAFALVTALRQDGVTLKAPLLSVGYGGDLYSAGPAAEHDAQGDYFSLSYEPIEMHTAATELFSKAMKTYAGVTEDPTLNQYIGFLSVVAFVDGLKAAGSDPTQAQVINAMLRIRDWNAAGLFGSHSIGFAMDQRGLGSGADNCLWVTRFSGTTFHLVPGADPICGKIIPGKTVAAAS